MHVGIGYKKTYSTHSAASVPVRCYLQAQRHLHLQQASVLQEEAVDLLAQLLFLRLQARQVLLPKQEVKQEKEAFKKNK